MLNLTGNKYFTPLKIIGVSLSFLLMACSTVPRESADEIQPSLLELLQQEPAVNSIQASLLNTAFLRSGANGIYNLCLLLVSADTRIVVQAEYALNSVSMFVTRPELSSERRKFLRGIYLALQDERLCTQRPLLICLLKICGDESSIKPLAVLLKDESLSRLVAPTLQNIGAGNVPAAAAAGNELLAALTEASAAERVAIIQALGQLKFIPAASRISEFIDDHDTVVSFSAVSALTRMGYTPLRQILLERIATRADSVREQLIRNYLQLVENLADKSMTAQYCREINTNLAGYFSIPDRLVALNMLVDISGTSALADVLKFMDTCQAKDQLNIIPLLKKMDNAALINAVSTEKDKFPAEWRAGFISMLSNKTDTASTVPFINRSLQDPAAVVRASAVKAILQIKPVETISSLLPLMGQEADSAVLLALQNGFLSMPTQDVIPVLVKHYQEMAAGSKQVVLNLIAEHQVKNYTSLVIDQVSAEPAEPRKTAMRILAELADKQDLPVLLNLLQKAASAEREILFRSILALIDRYGHEADTDRAIAEYAEQVKNSGHGFLLRMLKQSGNDRALQILRVELKSQSPEVKDMTWRTLCEWPRLNALDDLIKLAAAKEDLTYRVLAVRACLRLLQENDLGKEIELQYYKTILKSAPRVEDKELVLAAMADLRSASSLQFLSSLINDPRLGSSTTQTIMNMVQSIPDSGAELKKTEIAGILLQSRLAAGSTAAGMILQDEDSLHNQPPPGFMAMFNGRDLCGWQGLVADPPGRAGMSPEQLQIAQQQADRNMHAHWKVIDGMLCFDGQGENLCTVKDYENFELRLDWKIEKNGDSGIYLRGSPQVQIWDPGSSSGTGSGGLYNNQLGPSLPLEFADRPVGEWNTFRIIMTGSRVTVYLNEKLVVDNVVLENYWERDKPIYTKGPVELQAHYNPLYFRNIFIKEISGPKSLFCSNLFNGRDLSGWQIIDGATDSWQVQDSILYTTGQGGGWLSTERTFDNFSLELEYRLPPGGNSGIFIRAPHHGDPAYTGMEIQLLDDYSSQYKDLKLWQYCGSIYGIQAPAQHAVKSAGTWQKITIECWGQYVKVVLNDVLIIDADLALHMDKEAAHPGMKRRSGYIGLQNHSSRVEFRNIRLVELE